MHWKVFAIESCYLDERVWKLCRVITLFLEFQVKKNIYNSNHFTKCDLIKQPSKLHNICLFATINLKKTKRNVSSEQIPNKIF